MRFRSLRLVTPLALLTLLSCGGDGGGSGPDPDDAIASVTVTPANATVDVGQTTQFQATVRNGRGETVNAAVTWSSQATQVATVTGGVVTGVAEGNATIRASAGGKTGSAVVTVNDPNPPAAPSGLQVTPLSDTEVRLTWTDNATNEDEWRIEREQVALAAPPRAQAVFTVIATLGPNATSYTDTGLQPNTAYRYRVSACNENGCSGFSSEVQTETFEELTIGTASLPDGTINVAYSHTLQASQVTGGVTWSLASGTLPAGVTLSAAGVLSGTPTESGSFPVTVQAQGGGQTVTRALTLVVNAVILPPEITTGSLPDGGVGVPYAASLQATKGDGTYVFSVVGGGLPPGVTLAADGTLSGTPTGGGTFAFTARVQSAGLSTDKALSIEVHPALSVTTASLPDGVVGVAYSESLVAAGGDGTFTWSLDSGALPDGLTLAPDGTISGTPTTAGTFDFTVGVESGVGQTATADLSITIHEPLELTTTSLPDATLNQAYSETLAATGGDGSYTWSITAGALPGGLSLDAGTGVISGTPTAGGTFDFTVQVASGDGQTATADLSIEVLVPPLDITTLTLPGATLGEAYSQTLAATGGDGTYTWSIVNGTLPPGLSLDANTGLISGTPTMEGTSIFTVRVSSAGQTADRAFSIQVTSNTPVQLDVQVLDLGYPGVVYSDVLTASNGDGTYAFSITQGSLPPGLSLNGATGEISGTPTTPGMYHFTVQVASDGLTDFDVFGLTISTNAPAGFNMTAHNVAGVIPSAAVQTAINLALAKWEDVITTDLAGRTYAEGQFDGGSCDGFAIRLNGETVDDMVVFVNIVSIDGPGGTLASAGPCSIRGGAEDPGTTVFGRMKLDADDLANLDAVQLRAVVFHEIGHIVGIGTLWDCCGNSLITGATGSAGGDPRYVGAKAVDAYQNTLGGTEPTIPVANTGGSGTVDAHWREATFNTEIMTGFSEPAGVAQPISVMTVGAVEDLGYTVDYGAAEAYSIPAPPMPGAAADERGPWLYDEVLVGPIFVSWPDGRITVLPGGGR